MPAFSEKKIPMFFQNLVTAGLITSEDIVFAEDGFCILKKSIATILISQGIDTYPDSRDTMQECALFFDDWFFYAVPAAEENVCSLVKMREQEFDREKGLSADGDTPGVTVSFIAFDTAVFEKCLKDSSMPTRKALGMEINRVVADRNQVHHPDLKGYFVKPESYGSYSICDLYLHRIAAFADRGELAVPKAYAEIFHKRNMAKKYARIPDFVDENNRKAGHCVCDHRMIYIHNKDQLTRFEKLAILATHTGNVSYHSFAAEVRYHALFLVGLAKIRLPLLGSPYDSAIRADMSIGDKELQGPTPYYDLSGKLVTEQIRYHGEIPY